MKVGILGHGEIGKALHELYKDAKIVPIIRDLKHKKPFDNLNVLNICIPYSNDFGIIVQNKILETNAKLTIIHSTVPIGTTKNIKKNLTHHIIHSPVIGSHPFIKKSLTTFIKFIGSSDHKAIRLAQQHYKLLGIKNKVINSSDSTEAAKLLCTTYYGLCIAWHDYMKFICDEHEIDFSIIKEWNNNYNEGYKKLKLSKYNRPILDHPNGKIGGHCVIPNAELLNKQHPNNIIKEILKLK